MNVFRGFKYALLDDELHMFVCLLKHKRKHGFCLAFVLTQNNRFAGFTILSVDLSFAKFPIKSPFIFAFNGFSELTAVAIYPILSKQSVPIGLLLFQKFSHTYLFTLFLLTLYNNFSRYLQQMCWFLISNLWKSWMLETMLWCQF